MTPFELVISRLRGVRLLGEARAEALCPAHEDHHASLSVGVGGDGRVLVNCHASCEPATVVGAIGLTLADLFPVSAAIPEANGGLGKIVATYPYRDETGALLFQVVRYDPKTFRQRQPDGKGGWRWNLKGVRRVVYRLPEVLAAIAAGQVIWIVEGEKDAESLLTLGLCASCNPGGAGKWRPEYTKSLEGAAQICVVPDKDEPGRKHAHHVVACLRRTGIDAKIIDLPGEGKDASDWVAAGGTRTELEQFAAGRAASLAVIPDDAKGAGEAQDPDVGPDQPKAAAVAVEAAVKGLTLGHTADGNGWARLPALLGGYAARIQGRVIRRLVQRAYYGATGKPIGREALVAAIDLLEARAMYDSPEVVVHLRIAAQGDAVYIDLGRPKDPRAVRVTPGGWKIVRQPRVWFCRPGGMLPLPVPRRGGSLAELRSIHPALADDSTWALVGAWAVSIWRPWGGYAILAIRGEAGSGKTTLARMLLAILDPREADLRRPPGEGRDLIAAASATHVYALDNVSHIPEWLADDLCRVSTGAALTTRELYTTADEYAVRVRRPVLITSIPDTVSARADLRDRSAMVALEPMDDAEREEDAEIDRRIDAIRPRIVGALLDAVVVGLSRRPSVRLPVKIRMVDHLSWAVACGPALGLTDDQIIEAHLADRQAGATAAIDDSTVGRLICDLATANVWTGTAAELLAVINTLATDDQRRDRDWPRTPRAMRACLDRLAPSLRRLGIGVTLPDGRRHRDRRIVLRPSESPTSPGSPNPLK